MMHVQPVSATVSVVASSNVLPALQARRVPDVLVQVVQDPERVAAAHQPVRRHVVTANLAVVRVRMQVRVLFAAVAHVLLHVLARVPVLVHPAPVAHVAQPFFPSNLSDNRLARPACKICHHEYLN